MPLYQINSLSKNAHYLIWLITETEQALWHQLSPSPRALQAYHQLTHPRKRLEWLAARLALKELCRQLAYPYQGLVKDPGGRPYLIASHFYISLSHGFPFALAAISKQEPIGVDLQFLHPKLKKVKKKFLNAEESKDSGQDLAKLGIYWSAKEAIYKAYGKSGLSLSQDISIKPFSIHQQGTLQGQAKAHDFTIAYSFIKDHVLACCQVNNNYHKFVSDNKPTAWDF